MPDDHEAWRRLGSRIIHRTPFLTLRQDRVRTHLGQELDYGVVECGRCVGVLPFVDPDHVVLVRQYRYIIDRFTWEMPTGGVESQESCEQAAARECTEESGYRPGRLLALGPYHTSKSSIDETAWLYLGFDLVPGRALQDATEHCVPHVLPFEQVLGWVLDNTITDSMTIIAVLRAARMPAP